jgi:type I restriction enzyme S subunit
MKFGLEQHIIDKLIAVFEQHSKVDKAFVFGSRAKGNYRPDSDIDITIKGQELNTDDIIAMSVAFEEKGITHKVDLINYDTIKEPDLKDHIDRVGIELYSRWKEYKILELGKVVTGNTPSSKFPEEFGYEMPFVTPTDYKNYNKWISIADRNLSDKGINKLKSRVLPANSLLVTCIGSDMGKIAINKIPVVTNQQINSIITNEKINPDFLYYKLVSCYDVLRTYGEAGTAVPIVNKGDFENIEITIPSDLKEQTAIASILSSLDDKIDLLHRQNKTLEQLAETLFRQWFVEEAEDSWEETSLSEIADHSKENIHPSKNPTKLYKHYSLPAFDAGKEPILEIGKEILSNKYKVISNSILVSKLNPRTPRIWMIYGNVNEDESICSTEFQIVKPKDQKWYGFIYCFLKSYNVTQELAGASSGTSGSHQRVNPQDIFNLTFFKPTDILVEKFSKVIDNYLVKINNNQTQIRTLTQTRDNLLPKLMSGEVRVNL